MSSNHLFSSIKVDPAWRPHFTSDLHLFHKTAATKRGFRDTDEMHLAMTADWNLKVKPKDLVFILGDVALGGRREEVIERLNRLHGRKWLVPGNHDASMHPEVVEACFERVLPMQQEIKGWVNLSPDHIKGWRFTLSHCPLLTWPGAHHGVMHLHGHSHGNLNMEMLRNSQGRLPRMLDVGLDTAHGMYPIPKRWVPYSLQEILTIMEGRGFTAVDHHTEKETA